MFEEKRGVGKQKQNNTVRISSGSAVKEGRDRVMSVLVNRGDGTSSMSSHQSGSWERLGRGWGRAGLISMTYPYIG